METSPQSTSTAKPSRTPRIAALDGVRGLAILLVLIWHFIPCQLVNAAGAWVPWVRRALYLTGSGVDLFFALSGFLIVGILVDKRSSENLLRIFYVRRACRILPLYFLILGLFLLSIETVQLAPEAHEWLLGSPLPTWSYATFTQNMVMGARGGFGAGFMAPTWSLAVEEQFYLITPLLILWLSPRMFVWALPVCMLSIPLLRMGFPGFHAYVNTPWRADPLLAGGCVALLVRSAKCMEMLNQNGWYLKGFSALLVTGIPLMVMWPGCMGVFGPTWLAVGYAFLILIAYRANKGIIPSVLQNPALMLAGKYSYGLYMFHQIVSGLLHGWIKGQSPKIAGPDDALITLLALIVSIAVAFTSYHVLEVPFSRLGHRFHYNNPI